MFTLGRSWSTRALWALLLVTALVLAACPAPAPAPAAEEAAEAAATEAPAEEAAAPAEEAASGDAMTTVFGEALPADAAPLDFYRDPGAPVALLGARRVD